MRLVATDGITSTLVGSGGSFHEDGPVTARANFRYLSSILTAPGGSIYGSTWQTPTQFARRKVSTDDIVSTVAGSGDEDGFEDGPGNEVVSGNLGVW